MIPYLESTKYVHTLHYEQITENKNKAGRLKLIYLTEGNFSNAMLTALQVSFICKKFTIFSILLIRQQRADTSFEVANKTKNGKSTFYLHLNDVGTRFAHNSCEYI